MTSPVAGATGAYAPTASTSSAAAVPGSAVAPTIVGTYKRQKPLFVRGEGVHMIDADGKRYLDFVAGIAVNSLGHADAGVMNAMQQAMSTGLIHTSNLYRTEPGEKLAQWLVDHSFADSVFFCNSGAEANEGAFKFARRWGRAHGGQSKFEIIALRGAFHGRLPGTLAATDRPSYRQPFRPLMAGVTIVERDLEELDTALSPETAAAVIVEPIQGEGGVRVVDHGFLRELRAMTRERNVLLILDEIQCGFGRTGSLFAYEQIGIEPDMMTLAKPIAAGLPMGAILVSADVATAMQPGDHGTTFGGGPFIASVAQHVVERLADPALLAHVKNTGAWLGDQLRAMSDRTRAIRDVRGTGFMWGVDVHEAAGNIVARAFEKGLLLVTAGDHTLRLLPPLVMTQEQLSEGLAIMESAINNA
ncbi:MAG: aspartate aminotransferase family protein [Gemmatimonas sp.]